MKNVKAKLIRFFIAGFCMLFLAGAWFVFPVFGFHNCRQASVVWRGWSENGNYTGRVCDKHGNGLSRVSIFFEDTSGGTVSTISSSDGKFVCEPSGEGLAQVEIESKGGVCRIERVNGGDLSGMTLTIKVK